VSVRIAAVLLLFLTTPAGAGVVYRFTSAYTGHPLMKTASGTVWVSGRNYRFALDPDPSNPRAWDVAVSNGTGKFLINLGNQTWYRDDNLPTVPRFGSRDATLRGQVKVKHEVEGTETVSGRSATKHAIRVEYKLLEDFGRPGSAPARVESNIGVTLLVWTTADFPSIPMQRHIATGLREADEALARIFESIEGMPLRYQLAATRAYDGGRPSTILVTTTFENIEESDVPASHFEVPKTFREQEPVIGFAEPNHR